MKSSKMMRLRTKDRRLRNRAALRKAQKKVEDIRTAKSLRAEQITA